MGAVGVGFGNSTLAGFCHWLLLLPGALPRGDWGRRADKARRFRYTGCIGARYPRGLRERSAKPPFVGSNPTRASRVFFLAHRITGIWLKISGTREFPEVAPILGKRASCLQKSSTTAYGESRTENRLRNSTI